MSDCGIPYQVDVSGLEGRMIPKVSHYNYEYMQSIGIHRFIDVVVGTVTAINRSVANVLDMVLSLYWKKKYVYISLHVSRR